MSADRVERRERLEAGGISPGNRGRAHAAVSRMDICPETNTCTGSSDEEGITLLDGASVCIRAVRAEDAERLVAFHAGLSPETLVARFLRRVPAVSLAQAQELAHVDHDRSMALVATTRPDRDAPIIAVAYYSRLAPSQLAPSQEEPTEAEIALVVADGWQRRGLGTALFHRLSASASAHGIQTFVADTLASNIRVLRMLRRARIPTTARVIGGEVQLRLDIRAQPD